MDPRDGPPWNLLVDPLEELLTIEEILTMRLCCHELARLSNGHLVRCIHLMSIRDDLSVGYGRPWRELQQELRLMRFVQLCDSVPHCVVAGSFALHRKMRQSVPLSWEPNDMDIWVRPQSVKRLVDMTRAYWQDLGCNFQKESSCHKYYVVSHFDVIDGWNDMDPERISSAIVSWAARHNNDPFFQMHTASLIQLAEKVSSCGRRRPWSIRHSHCYKVKSTSGRWEFSLNIICVTSGQPQCWDPNTNPLPIGMANWEAAEKYPIPPDAPTIRSVIDSFDILPCAIAISAPPRAANWIFECSAACATAIEPKPTPNVLAPSTHAQLFPHGGPQL